MYHKLMIRALCLTALLSHGIEGSSQEKSGTHEKENVKDSSRTKGRNDASLKTRAVEVPRDTGSASGSRERFPNDWENPLLPSRGTLYSHAAFIPYTDEASALQEAGSPFVYSLNGLWKFQMADNPSGRPEGFYRDSFDVSKWKDIHVPANWQVEGYDKFIFTDVEYPIPPNPPFVPADYNPVGSYKRSFDLPSGWKGKKIFLHLGAVNSFFYCWVNGRLAGFSKDSKTPAEFDISAMVHGGNNTVSIQVFRFSDGTYLEGQDMWKLSGIERDVYLVARPLLAIYDFFAKAGLDSLYKDGLLDLKVSMDHTPAKREQGGSLRVRLLDDPGGDGGLPLYEERQALRDRNEYTFKARIPGVRKWNAEQPNLYTLLIEQLDKTGKVIEAIVHHPGFRNIEIRHGLLLVNGVAVRIKGVNRHEHDMYTAKVITREGMVNDIRLFKQYHINAMRCSHYPNREEWYGLCDRYGIYVIDEANIECDGMSMVPAINTLSDKPDWKAAYLDRTRRMWERDKNHCSIITWSLGNESRWGDNFVATYTWLKSMDPTRPVQYEEARDNPYTDIICPMYKSLHTMQDFVREWRTRPMIQVEYAHMMGNSGGNLKDDWDMIYKYPQLQGGFIWDFCDQTFKRKDKNGRWFWAYGRDMGQVGATSDTSFCADGLFAADRTPHPQAFEVKKVYQYIGFSPMAWNRDRILVTNRFDFTDLNEFRLRWFVKADGKQVAGGDLPAISLAPHASAEINIPLEWGRLAPGPEYFLTVEAINANDKPFLPSGTVMAWEQWELGGAPGDAVKREPAGESTDKLNAARLDRQEDADHLILSGTRFAVSFDKHTGWLDQFSIGGASLLKAPLQPDFTRPATDNDIGNSQQIRCAVWEHAMEGARMDSFGVTTLSASGAVVTACYYLPVVDALYRMEYLVSGSGEVQVKVVMKAGKGEFPELPRFGLALILQPAYENVSWLGRGPFDNYQDRKDAAAVDVYSMKADSLFHPYPRAQESGYRTDIRWMSLLDGHRSGLTARGLPLFSAGVLHFDRTKMDFDRDAPENKHGGSMANDDLIRWNIDFKQEGVGGDNAWGAQTHSEYVLPYGDYSYSFVLKVLTGE